MTHRFPGWARAAGAAAVTTLAVAAGAAPAAAQELVAEPQRPTPVASYGGWLAWSEWDAASGRFHLMARVGGRPGRVDVAPRDVPFDVDLGRDSHGDVSAVYSRCRVEPGNGDPRVRQWPAGTPQWSTGRGCDLHKFTFATGRETRIAAANTARSSEFLPAIFEGRIAFARVYSDRRGAAGRRAHLYHRTIVGGERSAGLPEPPRAERGKVEPGPSSLELFGRRLAVAWETYREGPISEIDLITLGEGRRLVERVGSGEIQAINLVSGGIRGGRVHYGQGSFGDSTSGDLRRYRIRTGRHQTAVASPDRMLVGTAPAPEGAYTLVSGGVEAGCFSEREEDAGVLLRGPCALALLAPLDWRPHEPRRFRLR